MKGIIKAGIFLLLGTLLTATTTAQNRDISLKIGGCYFINCKRTIAFGEQAVMTVSGNDNTGRMVNFDIFSPSGTLDASLKDGNFNGAKAGFYTVNRFDDGFTVVDSRNDRTVLKVVSVENKAMKRNDLHVWADFFLPNGERFQCTPEECNVPMLQLMKGSTFKNIETAIQLN